MAEKYYEITSEYDKVSEACDIFRGFCLTEGIPENVSIKLEICLTEALNNVVKHSYKGVPGKNIGLLLTFLNYTLQISISDTGHARENVQKPKLEFDPEDIENLPEGGMGLFIIEEIMDETKYESDGKTNTFIMIKKI